MQLTLPKFMLEYWSRQKTIMPALHRSIRWTIATTFLLCLLPGLSVLAQTISGRIVSSDDNQPLPGVSIVVKGTNAGTTSRADGTYSINTSSKSTLTCRYHLSRRWYVFN